MTTVGQNLAQRLLAANADVLLPLFVEFAATKGLSVSIDELNQFIQNKFGLTYSTPAPIQVMSAPIVRAVAGPGAGAPASIPTASGGCQFKITRGDRRGLPCGKPGYPFCKQHANSVSATKPYAGTVGGYAPVATPAVSVSGVTYAPMTPATPISTAPAGPPSLPSAPAMPQISIPPMPTIPTISTSAATPP